MKYFVTHFIINSADADIKQIAREILADMAAECGYETFVDTEEGTDGYVQVDNYDEIYLTSQLAEFPVENVVLDFSTEEIEDQDWNETWEQEEGFEPIEIDGKLLVYDVLHTSEESLASYSGFKKVGIQARNAFGTGTHETTRMMISSLLAMDLEGKRVLDCGCGTGILAISALYNGAKEAVGYDIDEWSVENTLHNASLNGVGDRIKVLEGDSKVLSHVDGLFDVVVANINRNILLADMPVFAELLAADGVLLLSGFYEGDVSMLVDKASELHLSLLKKVNDGEWFHLVLGAG